MAVTVLHPLTDDTVGTSFDVLVAYDFQAYKDKASIRVTCTLSGNAATRRSTTSTRAPARPAS